MADFNMRTVHFGALCRNILICALAIFPTLLPAADSDIVINEIMYHPDTDCEGEEFLEFYNRSLTETVDMSNWQIVNGVSYIFPPGTILGPGQYAVVCRDITAFNDYYGTPTLTHLGQWTGKLSNNGEKIELVNALAQTIQSIRYNDKRPWPISPDGGGPSLERINPNDDETSAGYWRAANANLFSTMWKRYEVTGVATSTTVYFYLDAEGECLIDDVELRQTASPAVNYINNGGFETAAPFQWNPTGNHSSSGRVTTDAHSGAASLRLKATGSGGMVSGLVWQTAQPLVLDGPQYTLSFWVKGLQPGVNLVAGLRGGSGASWSPTNSEDIGPVGVAGSTSYDAGTDTYTISASGSDIWGTSDEFRYTYAPMSGDGSLEATVAWVTPNPGSISSWCKAGIMIRESNSPTAPYVYAMIRADYNMYLQYRTNGNIGNGNSGGPVRLRLTRQGNDFIAEADTGGGFSEIARVTGYSMATNALIGFAVTSHNNGQLITASFEQPTGAGGSGFLTQVSVPNFMATPGSQNSRYSTNVPPYIRNVDTLPDQPTSSDPIEVHAKITDPDGITSAVLRYQIVSPGSYIRLGDPAYQTNWTDIPMALSSTPSVYVATIPAQAHRTLVRYRIAAQDGLGAFTTVPYADDTEPNYARFVYDGVPDYVAAQHPGSTPLETLSGLTKVPVLHLIANPADVDEAQTVRLDSAYGAGWQIERRKFKWRGTVVINGKVYDHIRFRMRGGTWRYKYQKRMWKFRFNQGHRLHLLHNDGTPYSEELRTLNLLACIQTPHVPTWVRPKYPPYQNTQRGEGGIIERSTFWLMQQAGAVAPDATWLHFRIIDDASEAGVDPDPSPPDESQYYGDFFGLYLGVQGMDERMLRTNGRPVGNFYKMDSYGRLPGGPPYFQDAKDCALPENDIDTFISGYSSSPSKQWWLDNLRFDTYYSVRAIVDCVHHGDMVGGKNYYYYHNPDTLKWELIAWDFDLCFGTDFGDARKPWRDQILRSGDPAFEEFEIKYHNRLREVIQLLFNPEKFFPVLDQWYDLLKEIAKADMYRWDWAPLTAPSDGQFNQHGIFQPLNVRLGDIKEWIRQRVNYLTNAPTRDWWLERGWTWPRMTCWDPDIPATPTLTAPRAGRVFGPNQSIPMSSTAFSDPNGGDTHGSSMWIATHVGGNELKPDWTSGETTVNKTSITIPPGALAPGTYWLRVKHFDQTGRASWWSDPVTITVSDQPSAVRRWKEY